MAVRAVVGGRALLSFSRFFEQEVSLRERVDCFTNCAIFSARDTPGRFAWICPRFSFDLCVFRPTRAGCTISRPLQQQRSKPYTRALLLLCPMQPRYIGHTDHLTASAVGDRSLTWAYHITGTPGCSTPLYSVPLHCTQGRYIVRIVEVTICIISSETARTFTTVTAALPYSRG